MPIQRRRVCYLSGFDPSGPSHYHKLYRDQAALQAAVTGDRIEVGPRRRISEHAAQWSVGYTPAAGGATVQTDLRFWRWDDIVRTHWPRESWRLLLAVVRTTGFNLRHGAAWRMLQLSWPAFLALFGPAMLLLGVVVGAPLLGLGAAALLLRAGGSLPVSVAAALLSIGLVLLLARRLDARLHMQWLVRSFAFTSRQATDRAPDLEQRLDTLARELVEDVRHGGFDEILLVGHSSGTIMALAVLARALQQDPLLATHGPRVALLTLGHCTPMLSSLPQAARFRDELARVGQAEGIAWIDVSAPPDGCCFALCEPLAAAGLPPATRPDHPKLLSPRVAALFSPARYAEIRRDPFRLHFQYVMASELAGDYDYFAITAGPQTLAERFADHASVTGFARFRQFERLARRRPTH
jgi:hypothetical protein